METQDLRATRETTINDLVNLINVYRKNHG